jgi:serine/threonine protein phosphatase 1
VLVHKYITMNTSGQDFFVGDIHGEYALLLQTLKQCRFNFDCDRLFSVGDIVDRGPDPKSCIQLLEQPWFYAVRGNHEEMLFAEPGSELAQIHHGAGGEWFFQCDSVEKKHLQDVINRHCPIAFTITSELGDIGVSHASAPQNWRMIQEASESDIKLLQDCMWSIRQFQQVKQGQLSLVENIKVTIHGHVNCQQVTTNMNQLWIDTLLRTKRLTVLSAKQVCMVIA